MTWKFALAATAAWFVGMTSLFCLGHLVVHGSWPSWQ